MTLLGAYNTFCNRRLFWPIIASMYLLLFLITVILFRTFGPTVSPISVIVESVETVRKHEVIELKYDRKIIVSKNFVGSIQREIILTDTNSENRSLTLARVYREFKIGEYNKVDLFLLPAGLPNGTYVLKTYLIWKPDLSLADRFIEISQAPFKICNEVADCVRKE